MDETILQKAEFDRRVTAYWLTNGAFICVCAVVLIPVIPLWLLIGAPICTRYLKSMSAEFSARSLIVKKGMLNRVEKTIPLEKITDLALYQGPIMRFYGVEGLKVETAGQSSGAGSLVSLVGVVEARAFRDAVLTQRELLADSSTATTTPAAPTVPAGSEDMVGVLMEIRDLARRIEQNTRKD